MCRRWLTLGLTLLAAAGCGGEETSLDGGDEGSRSAIVVGNCNDDGACAATLIVDGITYEISPRSCVRERGDVIATSSDPAVPVSEARQIPGVPVEDALAFRSRAQTDCSDISDGWFAGWTNLEVRPLPGSDLIVTAP